MSGPVVTFLVAEIAVEPGWAVGAVRRGDDVIDRDVLVGGDGDPQAPGSALAGSLRAHLARQSTVADLDETLMGPRPPKDRDEATALTASRLWLLGTRFVPAGPPADIDQAAQPPAATGSELVEIVGQTAIDPQRRAAATSKLRRSRTVAVGGTVHAYLRHDGELDEAHLAVLAGWRPAIGRDRSTGGGRATLRTLRVGKLDLGTPDGLRTWLELDGPALVEAVVGTGRALTGPDEVEPYLSVRLQIVDGLLIGGGKQDKAAVSRTRRGQPIVPGSAWKGVFRSRIEYILRSLHGDEPPAEVLCPVDDRCDGVERLCWVCHLFGTPGRRGLLAFRDSVIETPTTAGRTQVGIDRVTGGARDQLLFSSRPVVDGTLTLRIDSLDPDGRHGPVDAVGPTPGWARTVLSHVLRDLDDGLIGIGSRVSRGLGGVRVVDPQIPTPLPPVLSQNTQEVTG
ncbi:CRISPR/Cas system CSM-associated protein Csm3 (group 7 of RAMP superfamily) [Micromonospora sp. Llam0]|uniref:RAMP superfamily CRISPR-associated protein n=1 Tax=Micromonospora sp. Llam0 TaxID=2485143 RepID=UPI000F474301|nr:RAMP superfamily CRISPR-associated protein [Micromonospora sp. Llam0]ROO59617.1 CRISPR/Cas system CSM-associated protein Csm3 (group 7 of RAMP superfamily) [Micromonospora sp. Llam0]